MRLRRRDFIVSGALSAGALAAGPGLVSRALGAPAHAGAGPYGPLRAADGNGLMLPDGFSSRLIARGGRTVAGTSYRFPIYPDGQATFRTRDGGWILVTNSETTREKGAGVSAIRFSSAGRIRSAKRVLADTDVNCAGGPTPWGTWLSCEEQDDGLVWECDPAGVLDAVARPALGVFAHEAAAVDPAGKLVYMTEDRPDGGFYRFAPDSYPDLSAGIVQAAVVAADGTVAWHRVADPSTAESRRPVRRQVSGMTPFDGGEGIWYSDGTLYFTTKGDKKVWAYDARAGRIEVIFDREAARDSSLNAVDNITVSASGDLLVCEDGGNMEIGLIARAENEVAPLLRFVGSWHEGSEVTGACFDPSGTRLYLSSQRAYPSGGSKGPGAVYEISGPFRGVTPRLAAAAAFGPPAGELRPNGPLAPVAEGGPAVTVRVRRFIPRRTLLRSGVRVDVRSAAPGTVAAVLRTGALASVAGTGGSTSRPVGVTLARASARIARRRRLRLRLGRSARRRLAQNRGRISATVTISVRDRLGRQTIVTRRIGIGRKARR